LIAVEQWAEIRRMHFVEKLAIKEIARRTGRDRKTIRRALRSAAPPTYRREPAASKLDPHREQIAHLLRSVQGITNTRIRELISEDGYRGSKTILDDYLRELRPIVCPKRTFQRTAYRPGELLQFDLFEPKAEMSATAKPAVATSSPASSGSHAPPPARSSSPSALRTSPGA
jgi:transposase